MPADRMDIPLICDAEPGAWVLRVPPLTAEQASQARRLVTEFLQARGTRVLVLEEGCDLQCVDPGRRSPDAEFCAA